MAASGKPKTARASPFEGAAAGGWRPTRKQPAQQRELTPEPPGAKDGTEDDAQPQEMPANGVASHGAADSRKI